MIIKKLNLISFGKFKDKTIELNDGFNAVSGDNEAGKSTLAGFIYAMLTVSEAAAKKELIFVTDIPRGMGLPPKAAWKSNLKAGCTQFTENAAAAKGTMCLRYLTRTAERN